MTTEPNNATETRIRENAHFARLLRQRLESRHGNGALRETLARMSDSELIEAYLNHERLGREHAKRRAGSAGE
jgi:hypothetical protein